MPLPRKLLPGGQPSTNEAASSEAVVCGFLERVGGLAADARGVSSKVGQVPSSSHHRGVVVACRVPRNGMGSRRFQVGGWGG